MAIDHFKPKVWSASLLTALETSHVYAGPGVANRDYEGEIRNAGDTVHITSISDPDVFDYVAGETTINPQQLATAQRSLQITESKAFAFEVDDVDARQALGGVMGEAMQRSGYRLRDLADRFSANRMLNGAQAANVIGATHIVAQNPTGSQWDAYQGIVQLNLKLDEADVPDEGRFVVIPSWYHSLLLLDPRFTDASARGEQSAALNGQVGMVANTRVLRSNNAPLISGDDFAVIAGTAAAYSFAEQIRKVEAFRPESSFSDAVKGLHLYGGKVVRPDHLAVLTASKTAV